LKLINFILNSNIFLAVAAVMLTLSAQVQLGLKPEFHNYLLLIFFATLFVYNHHRINNLISGKQTKNPDKYRWYFENKRTIIFLFVFSITGLIVVAITTDIKLLIALFSFGVFTFFYSMPVSGKKNSLFALREIPFLKIFIISFVWSGATIVLPVVDKNLGIFSKEVILLFTERFFFVFAIAIPFDIRDIKEDFDFGLKTFPILFDSQKALKLSFVALVLGFLISGFHYLLQNNGFIVLALLVSTIVTLVFLSPKSFKKTGDYYYHFLDGTLVLQGILVLVFYFLK
jgi:4-hydroxybenzoate polyprenyltransferase